MVEGVNFGNLSVNNVLPEVSRQLEPYLRILQAAGVILLVYIVYMILKSFWNYKRWKRVLKIEKKVDNIDEKINNILEKLDTKEKKNKKKKKKSKNKS